MKIQSLLAVAVAALFVTACSDDKGPGQSSGGGVSDDGGSNGTGSSSTSPTSERAPSCTVTATSEIRSTLTEPNIGEPEESHDFDDAPKVTLCLYPEGTLPSKVSIQYGVGITDERWAEIKKSFPENDMPTTPVPGLGDDAITTSSTNPNLPTLTTVNARKGSHYVQVVSRQSLEPIKTLVASLLTHF